MTKPAASRVTASKAEYGNWVAKRLVYVPAVIGAVLLAGWIWTMALAILAVLFFGVAGYFAYARYLFAPQGGNVQAMVWTTLLGHVQWGGKGRALDIGCGSGAITIRLAQTYPNATVIGVDLWGKEWEYTKSLCERNAAIEGVAARVTFQRGSASSLPFPDESFDVVVSNLTFHEVKDVQDKRLLIKEALRVLKKDGTFAFQDLFLLKGAYGKINLLLESTEAWGATKPVFVETRNAQFIPRALKLPFMIGTMGLMFGKK